MIAYYKENKIIATQTGGEPMKTLMVLPWVSFMEHDGYVVGDLPGSVESEYDIDTIDDEEVTLISKKGKKKLKVKINDHRRTPKDENEDRVLDQSSRIHEANIIVQSGETSGVQGPQDVRDKGGLNE